MNKPRLTSLLLVLLLAWSQWSIASVGGMPPQMSAVVMSDMMGDTHCVSDCQSVQSAECNQSDCSLGHCCAAAVFLPVTAVSIQMAGGASPHLLPDQYDYQRVLALEHPPRLATAL